MQSGRGTEGGSYRYGFNGKKTDPETELNDFGARFYAANLGRWLSIDPLFQKYVSHSPYHFGYCNPITTIDIDGEENIIVIGGQYDKSNANKLMFFNQAIAKAREYKKREPSENTTFLVYTDGYTQEHIQALQGVAKQHGIKLQLVQNADEVVNYFNAGDISCKDEIRTSDKVTNVDVFCHGLPGSFELGYGLSTSEQGRFSYSQAMALKKEAFDENATLTSFSCRTGAGADLLRYNIITNGDKSSKPELSLAQSIADNAKITVFALLCRSDYSNTISTQSERMEVKRGELYPFPKDSYEFRTYKALDNMIRASQEKLSDGKVFMPNGARHSVQGGSTPWGVSNDLKTFKPRN